MVRKGTVPTGTVPDWLCNLQGLSPECEWIKKEKNWKKGKVFDWKIKRLRNYWDSPDRDSPKRKKGTVKRKSQKDINLLLSLFFPKHL